MASIWGVIIKGKKIAEPYFEWKKCQHFTWRAKNAFWQNHILVLCKKVTKKSITEMMRHDYLVNQIRYWPYLFIFDVSYYAQIRARKSFIFSNKKKIIIITRKKLLTNPFKTNISQYILLINTMIFEPAKTTGSIISPLSVC